MKTTQTKQVKLTLLVPFRFGVCTMIDSYMVDIVDNVSTQQVYTKVYIVQRGLGHTIVFYVIVKHDLKSRSSASSTPAHVSGQSYLEQRTRASNWFQ